MEVRKGDKDTTAALSRANCEAMGCLDWRKTVEGRFCGILQPEEGALAKLHEKINDQGKEQSKSAVSWKVFAIFITIMMTGLSTSIYFTAWSNNDIKGIVQGVVATQDAVNKDSKEERANVSIKFDKLYDLILAQGRGSGPIIRRGKGYSE